MPYAQAWLASVGHSPVTLNGGLVESGHPALLQSGDTFEVSHTCNGIPCYLMPITAS